MDIDAAWHAYLTECLAAGEYHPGRVRLARMRALNALEGRPHWEDEVEKSLREDAAMLATWERAPISARLYEAAADGWWEA